MNPFVKSKLHFFTHAPISVRRVAHADTVTGCTHAFSQAAAESNCPLFACLHWNDGNATQSNLAGGVLQLQGTLVFKNPLNKNRRPRKLPGEELV
jgi:hypothetical protein